MKGLLSKQPNFVHTRNTDKITRSAYQAVKNNSWLAVTGEVGMGKTFLYNSLVEFFSSQPNRYILVHAGPAWESALCGISIPFVMKHMIRTIRPGEQIPGNLNERYFRLREHLIWANSIGRKVVLVIDEAQALRISGLRDLKKIWEIASGEFDHLFSIIMFLKPETKISAIFAGPEIGHRVTSSYMAPLERSELLKIAEEGFGIKFERGKAGETTRDLFVRGCRWQTPLAVKHMIEGLVFAYPEIQSDRTVRETHVRNVLSDGYTKIMQRLRISLREIKEGIRLRHKKLLDNGTIQAALKGEDTVSPEIVSVVRSELVNRIREKTKKYDESIFSEIES
ncbi:ATP-binding protein [Leptospira licerasiae]|uniref:AAA domain protein n=1 Tax=Leptospira licerasiae str. MMD4847 TaxID=1049971 RepID=A0ABN0HAG7_9LEPT|nr:ATP-binding protein [Leptospira licerasiae]EIE03248.1 hypothetical protein LEP1GSC185_0966 [Leptospira licerasiae serovar Varillal str. VAR 010]EJZ42575.1 AAA domain protein [Leptospira licerasiae str. MMD4847]